MFNCQDLDHLMVYYLEDNVMGKMAKVRLSKIRPDLSIRLWSLGYLNDGLLELFGKSISQLRSIALLVKFHDFENVEASLDMVDDTSHLRRSSKNLKNSACERTLLGSSSISRLRLSASSISST